MDMENGHWADFQMERKSFLVVKQSISLSLSKTVSFLKRVKDEIWFPCGEASTGLCPLQFFWEWLNNLMPKRHCGSGENSCFLFCWCCCSNSCCNHFEQKSGHLLQWLTASGMHRKPVTHNELENFMHHGTNWHSQWAVHNCQCCHFQSTINMRCETKLSTCISMNYITGIVLCSIASTHSPLPSFVGMFIVPTQIDRPQPKMNPDFDTLTHMKYMWRTSARCQGFAGVVAPTVIETRDRIVK